MKIFNRFILSLNTNFLHQSSACTNKMQLAKPVMHKLKYLHTQNHNIKHLLVHLKSAILIEMNIQLLYGINNFWLVFFI